MGSCPPDRADSPAEGNPLDLSCCDGTVLFGQLFGRRHGCQKAVDWWRTHLCTTSPIPPPLSKHWKQWERSGGAQQGKRNCKKKSSTGFRPKRKNSPYSNSGGPLLNLRNLVQKKENRQISLQQFLSKMSKLSRDCFPNMCTNKPPREDVFKKIGKDWGVL